MSAIVQHLRQMRAKGHGPRDLRAFLKQRGYRKCASDHLVYQACNESQPEFTAEQLIWGRREAQIRDHEDYQIDAGLETHETCGIARQRRRQAVGLSRAAAAALVDIVRSEV